MQQLPPSASEHYRSRIGLQVATLAAVRRLWGRMGLDFEAAWAQIGPQILLVVSAAQLQAAAEAEAYIALAALQQGIDPAAEAALNGRAFLGWASDGRPMASLLSYAVVEAKAGVAQGMGVREALARGMQFLDMVTLTQVADAGRGAELVTMTATPAVTGYVRMLNPPSCSRCVILAGKRFSWNNDFRRHPRCDCLTIPSSVNLDAGAAKTVSPEAYFESLTPQEQVATFSADGARAIRDGASPITVVNANRGTFTPTGRRSPTAAARRMPGDIYREAGDDRARALELLRSEGYLT